MALDYTTYQARMASLLVITDYLTNADWAVMLPQMIADAEGRCYRDLDMLAMNTIAEVASTPSTRAVTVPGGIIIVESAYAVTPAGVLADLGTRNPLRRISYEAMSSIWPSTTTTGVPEWYAMKDDETALLAPTPDAAYRIEFSGEMVPAALSVSNTTTVLTEQYPDLFVAASMIFGTGWQRDYGSAADDPASAVSWTAVYKDHLASAVAWEQRKDASGTGWQGFSDTIAEPKRGS